MLDFQLVLHYYLDLLSAIKKTSHKEYWAFLWSNPYLAVHYKLLQLNIPHNYLPIPVPCLLRRIFITAICRLCFGNNRLSANLISSPYCSILQILSLLQKPRSHFSWIFLLHSLSSNQYSTNNLSHFSLLFQLTTFSFLQRPYLFLFILFRLWQYLFHLFVYHFAIITIIASNLSFTRFK